jgi:uncharacterized membrane protein YozB (DUF420 family)
MRYAITRSWPIAPVFTLAVAFVAFGLAPYLTFDPSRSRIPAPPGVPGYYPLLVAHVIFGSVAMLTCCFQLWPWFRGRYPTAHRNIGLVYVFCGVIPAGLLGLTIATVSPFGPTIRVSSVLLATLWLAVTIAGFRMARQKRFVEHRRWMIRSFALTLSVISNRLWGIVWFILLTPQLATTFGGNEALMVQTIAGLSGWLGWVIPLIVAEWWLERDGVHRARITKNS